MRKLIVIISLMSCINAKAQHLPLQSQYMYNAIALNPAYTGSEDAFSIVGTFRAQWLGFSGAPTTQSLTAHAPLKGMKSAVGLQFFADQIGVTRNTGIFGSYAYRLQVSQNSSLAFGASGGINFIKNNFSELQGNDSDDETIMNDSPLGILPDISIGLNYYSKKFFISASVPMFLSHRFDGGKFKIENNFKNYNFMLGGGYVFKLKNDIEIKPSMLTKYRINAAPQFDFNLMSKLNKTIEIGASYRTSEAIIGLVKVNITEQFSFMYSAGIPLNSILKYTFGSHELSLKYNFLYKSKMTSPRFLGW